MQDNCHHHSLQHQPHHLFILAFLFIMLCTIICLVTVAMVQLRLLVYSECLFLPPINQNLESCSIDHRRPINYFIFYLDSIRQTSWFSFILIFSIYSSSIFVLTLFSIKLILIRIIEHISNEIFDTIIIFYFDQL